MKKSILLGLAISLLAIGCEDKKADLDNDIIDESVKEFTSVNIKTSGPEFFTFTTNKGTTTEPSAWDLSFRVVDFQPSPLAPVIKDPVMVIGSGKKATKVEVATITDVTTIPAGTLFKADENGYYTTQGWYNYDGATHVITPKDFVYIVDVDDTKYALIEITDYYDENGTSGTITIHWKYLEKKQ